MTLTPRGPLTFRDLDPDVLGLIVNHAALTPCDRANVARSSAWLREAVVFTTAVLHNPARHLPAALRQGRCQRLHIGDPRSLLYLATTEPECCRRVTEVIVVNVDDVRVLQDGHAVITHAMPALQRITVVYAQNPCCVPQVACDSRVWYASLSLHFSDDGSEFPWRARVTDHLTITGTPNAAHLESLERALNAGFRVRHLTVCVLYLPHADQYEVSRVAQVLLSMTEDVLDVETFAPGAEDMQLPVLLVGAYCDRVNASQRVPALTLQPKGKLLRVFANNMRIGSSVDRLTVSFDVTNKSEAMWFAKVAPLVRSLAVTLRERHVEVASFNFRFPPLVPDAGHITTDLALTGSANAIAAIMSAMASRWTRVTNLQLYVNASCSSFDDDIGPVVAAIVTYLQLRRLVIRALVNENTMRWLVDVIILALPSLQSISTTNRTTTKSWK